MTSSKVIEAIDTGIVIFGSDFKISYWNGWMAAHSQIQPEEIVGRSLFDPFPKLKNQRFMRNCKSVRSFGNFVFFPQDPYGYLFPMKPVGSYRSQFKCMQQSCTLGAIRDGNKLITDLFISVRDMTEVAAYQKELIRLSHRDALTGCHNRRFLIEFLEEELYRCQRYHRNMSIVMMDIDYFKKVNDRWGHPFGDEVLKWVSSTVQAIMRKSNRFARYGGEEFCCVLPETNIDGATVFAEKIRKSLEASALFSTQSPISVTASFGVSSLNEEIKDIETLLKKADEALYRAKEGGRNRVALAE